MSGVNRFKRKLLKAVVLLSISITAPSATAQLSRARAAARRSVPVKPAPKETKAELEKEADPTPAAAAPIVTAAPKNTPRQRPAATPRASSAARPPQPKPALQRARQKVRRAAPVQPTPAPKPAPPRRPPAPKPPRHRTQTHFHKQHHRCATAPLFIPTYTSQTVFVDRPSPPPPVFTPTTIATDPLPLADTTFEVAPSPEAALPLPCSEPTQPPFITPHVIQPLRFAEYPYAHGLPGLMARGPSKTWSGSVLFEYGSDFDRLDRRGFGFLAEHSSRFGIDFKWDSYIEDLGQGVSDELHFTDINVLFRIAESEQYVVRAGLGANILGDAFATDSGFNVTAKIDLFPADPLVLSAEVDLGTIGNAETFHVQGKAGLMLGRFEFFGGYDYRTIGSVPLRGAILGLQVWF